MFKLFQALYEEAERVTVSEVAQVEPPHIAASHEHVIGELPMTARQIYALANRWNVKAKGAEVALARCLPTHRQKFQAEHHEASTTRDLLMSLLWWGIKSTFPILWEKEGVGLRHGWQVVWWKPGPDEYQTQGKVVIEIKHPLTNPPVGQTKH